MGSITMYESTSQVSTEGAYVPYDFEGLNGDGDRASMCLLTSMGGHGAAAP